MKNLNITFTDDAFNKLKKAKKLNASLTWEKFIIKMCTKGVSVKRNGNKL